MLNSQLKVSLITLGYVNPANTFLEFDVTLQGYQGTGSTIQITGGVDSTVLTASNYAGPTSAQVVRFENNIQSIFQRGRILYGATPLEDIIDYNVVVRELTEWTSGGATLDQNSIREGIGGVAAGTGVSEAVVPAVGGGLKGAPILDAPTGLLNVRQKFIQGIDTRVNLTGGVTSSVDGNYQITGQGYGIVPNQSSGQSTLTGDTYTININDTAKTAAYPLQTVCTRRYQIQFAFGLFTQDKLIPTKYMASQLAIELTLAPEASCIFVEQAPTSFTKTPTYQVTNVNLIPEILQFDSSYDAMFLRGLREGGVPIKFSSWHTFTTPATSQNMMMLIQERSRSVKALFGLQRRSTPSLTADSGASFFDSSLSTSTLQSYQYRIGGRFLF